MNELKSICNHLVFSDESLLIMTHCYIPIRILYCVKDAIYYHYSHFHNLNRLNPH